MRWSNFFHIYQPPAWDEAIIRRATAEAYEPMTRILREHSSVHITLNITGALIDQLVMLGLTHVLDEIRDLARGGQIELVGSAKYHPILPLLPLEEARRQIELQHAVCKKVFGESYHPKGFFAPEMAYSPALESVLLDMGFEWIILDEICGGRGIGKLHLNKRYTTPSGLGVIFRNRFISDFLSFSANIDRPELSVAAIQEDVRSSTGLVTAMDGENLGHHRAGVDRLWEILVTWPEISTSTLSEYRDALVDNETLEVCAGSWSSQEHEIAAGIPFSLWKNPDNQLHTLQWQLTSTVITAVQAAQSDPTYDIARRALDQVLTSDKYWWASASPWWDMTIVIRETQRLADVLETLTTPPMKALNAAGRIMKQIATTAELWEKTGLSKRRQATYLKTTGDVRYMGGKQV